MSKKYYIVPDDYERGTVINCLNESVIILLQMVNTPMRLMKCCSKSLMQNKRNSKWFTRRLNYGKAYLQ